MKVITDDYLNGVPQEEIDELTNELRTMKYTALDILLIHIIRIQVKHDVIYTPRWTADNTC
jgi:hypothetical protein